MKKIKYLLLSIFITCLILLIWINCGLIKNFSNKIISVAISSLLLFFLFHSWSKTQEFWQKYKNTKQLNRQVLSSLNCIILTIFFSFIFLLTCFLIYFPKPIPIFMGGNTFKLIALNFIFVFIWFLSSYLWNKKAGTNTKEENIFSLSDEPIETSKQDLFGRGKFIEDFHNSITNLPFKDSFVYGLYGSWGEGKTSVINLLKNKLEANAEYLIMSFEPWYFKDEEAILTAFYTQLENTLSKEFIFSPEFNKTFKKYLNLISVGIPQTGIKINFPHSDESAKKIGEKIGKYIEWTGKKIIIFIDDIDRLQLEEVLLVFKLIRLNTKFKNTIFVLSFDVNAIKEILKEKHDISHESVVKSEFIDKIVQCPINLPAIEHIYIEQFFNIHIDGSFHIELLKDIFKKIGDIKNDWVKIFVNIEPEDDYLYFKRELIEKDFNFISNQKDRNEILELWAQSKNNLFDKLKITEKDRQSFAKEFSNIYTFQLKRLFRTLRIIKRYLNGVYSTLPSVVTEGKLEVNLYDFFILEIIRIFYPKVYDDIWENWWFYVPEYNYLSSPFWAIDKKDRYPKIKKHAEEILNNEKDKDILMNLLEAIFTEVKDAFAEREIYSRDTEKNRKDKRLMHSEYFPKYFIGKIPLLELADGYIETTLGNWRQITNNNDRKEAIRNQIFKLQKENRLSNFFNKLVSFIYQIEESMAIDIIEIIYANVDNFSTKKQENFISEYDKADILLMKLINETIDTKKTQSMLEKIITETPSLYFAVNIIHDLKRKEESIYKTVKIDDLQDKLNDRLKKYFVDSGRDIFDELLVKRKWGFVLYQWATNWETPTENNKETVSKYIVSLLEKDAKKFIEFLNSSRHPQYIDLTSLNEQCYLTELQKLAEKFKNNDFLSDDEKNIIKEFSTYYEKYIGESLEIKDISYSSKNAVKINNSFISNSEGTFFIWAKVTEKLNSTTGNKYIIGYATNKGEYTNIGGKNTYINVFAIARFGDEKSWSFWSKGKHEHKGLFVGSPDSEKLSEEWHLFTVCWSKTKHGGFIGFYIDNKLRGQIEGVFDWPEDYSGDCYIGMWPNSAEEHYFDSKIGPYKILKEVVVPEYIKTYYEEGLRYLKWKDKMY
ncbi:MAG: P-loop NTPase fold protein [bacterium]